MSTNALKHKTIGASKCSMDYITHSSRPVGWLTKGVVLFWNPATNKNCVLIKESSSILLGCRFAFTYVYHFIKVNMSEFQHSKWLITFHLHAFDRRRLSRLLHHLTVLFHSLHYKNGRVALTWEGYLSCSFTTKQFEYKQIDYYIAGPL